MGWGEGEGKEKGRECGIKVLNFAPLCDLLGLTLSKVSASVVKQTAL